MTIKAIYEDGVFKPVLPVTLPDKAEVDVVLPQDSAAGVMATNDNAAKEEENQREIIEILSHRHRSGHHDLAARHNEHQP